MYSSNRGIPLTRRVCNQLPDSKFAGKRKPMQKRDLKFVRKKTNTLVWKDKLLVLPMGASYLSISVVCTLLSFVGLQYWTELSLEKLKSDGLVGGHSVESVNARHALQLLFGSQATIALLANFALNVFVLLILGLKTLFFVELYPSETRKLVERLINYVIYKGTFLPMIVPPTVFQVGLWSTWLTILCSLKMFQALARDRLDRLNASPSATPWTYFRVYSVLLLVISVDLLWLDQGLSENYSCPTCRKPLHMGRPEDEAIPRAADISTNEQLARQISSALELHNHPGHTLPTGVFPNQIQNPLESGALRGAGLDSSWLQTWSGQGLDGAGPSTGTRSVGLGRVQMMMRHLAAVGETYAQTTLEDTAWSLWPMNPSQAGTSNSTLPPAGSVGLHMRSTSRVANDNIANVLAMAETVREVLPHIPDELIFQSSNPLKERTRCSKVEVCERLVLNPRSDRTSSEEQEETGMEKRKGRWVEAAMAKSKGRWVVVAMAGS
ncbi:hypothetical protein TEA_003659 [Camellia sinensis var. sinensis]|uniref:E3 ubiquitin-protein ligase synoviolin-like TPR repeats domain-containing protein n=1 Tax=Camellia sinensis var. sinensis TaxID=542762 RepID=A0A4V3WMW8_CAMSN|nr:hypothetical protein TEA_003659 [Camellia sinensis var. sinensis]